MDALYKTIKPLNVQDLWRQVAKDFTKISDLSEVIKNLMAAGKIQDTTIGQKRGYLPKHEVSHRWDKDLILPDFLTDEEMTLGAGEG